MPKGALAFEKIEKIWKNFGELATFRHPSKVRRHKVCAISGIRNTSKNGVVKITNGTPGRQNHYHGKKKKKKIPSLPRIIMRRKGWTSIPDSRILEIDIEPTLNFENDINKICKKTGQKLNTLARISPYMALKKRNTIMKALIML